MHTKKITYLQRWVLEAMAVRLPIITTDVSDCREKASPGVNGFLVLSETADCECKYTDYYDSPDEASLLWNDLGPNISWRIAGDQIGCPKYAQDIAIAIIRILKNSKLKESCSGLYHFGGNICYSWAEFAKAIFDEVLNAKVIETRPKIVAITTEEFFTLAKRPS
jgi:glycosyltransferase involved in cell wall biosynthesis